jgi:para-nitrobenzyl esterase
MTKKLILAAALTTLAAGLAFAQQPEPVMVDGGRLQGNSEDGLTVYRGIPFAAPPVGAPYAEPVPSAEGLKSPDAYFAWRRTPEGEAWAK